MKVIHNVVDKSTWQEGPWQHEPDRVEWISAAGLPCLIWRSATHGALCGYVSLPPDHLFYGKKYSDLEIEHEPHGGLIFSGKRDGVGWWIGFDCSHWNDISPGFMFTPPPGAEYRDINYVIRECEQLAMVMISYALVTDGAHDPVCSADEPVLLVTEHSD